MLLQISGDALSVFEGEPFHCYILRVFILKRHWTFSNLLRFSCVCLFYSVTVVNFWMLSQLCIPEINATWLMMYYHLYMYICIFAGFHLQIFCPGILYICSQGTFICSFLLKSLPVWASALCSLKGIGKYCILMYFVKEFTIEITGDTIWAWSFLLDHFVNYKSISFFIYIWCSIAFSFSFFSCITYENVCFSRYFSISSKSGLGTLQPSGHLWPSTYVFGCFNAAIATWSHFSGDFVDLSVSDVDCLDLYRTLTFSLDLNFQMYWRELVFGP